MTFQCEVEGCGKLFSCKKTLKEHERTHTGERPYICPICLSTFAQYSSMQKHQRVHDKKKPYKCKYEGCQQAFTQISNLIRHERIHTGEKPYTCQLCKKKFASGSNLKQHMQVHNNEVQRIQFRCFVLNCEKAYLYVSSLKKHIQVSHPIQYETLIKTNKFDLMNCKEFISGSSDNHQLSDINEEEEEQLSHIAQNQEEEKKQSEDDQPQITTISCLNDNNFKLLKKRPFNASYEAMNPTSMYQQENQNNASGLNNQALKDNFQNEQIHFSSKRAKIEGQEQNLSFEGGKFDGNDQSYSDKKEIFANNFKGTNQSFKFQSLHQEKNSYNNESTQNIPTFPFNNDSANKQMRYDNEKDKHFTAFDQFQNKQALLVNDSQIPTSNTSNSEVKVQQSIKQNAFGQYLKQENGMFCNDQLNKRQDMTQLPRLTSLGLIESSNIVNFPKQVAQPPQKSPDSFSDHSKVFNFGALSNQTINKTNGQNSTRNQLPTTTLPLPVSFTQSNTATWNSGTPKNSLFSHQNSFGQVIPNTQGTMQPGVDVFTTLKQLYAELQQESSGSTFAKIQHYAVIAASATLVQLGLNGKAPPFYQASQQSASQMSNDNKSSNLVMKQDSFGAQQQENTYQQVQNQSEEERNSNFSFRLQAKDKDMPSPIALLRVDENSSKIIHGMTPSNQKRVYQLKSVSLKEHKELRVGVHPVTQEPTILIRSHPNSGKNSNFQREGSFSNLSFEVMIKNQKQAINGSNLGVVADSSNDIRDNSLLSPRNFLINNNNNDSMNSNRKTSLFKKFKYNPQKQERKDTDPSSFFGDDDDESQSKSQMEPKKEEMMAPPSIVAHVPPSQKVSCMCANSSLNTTNYESCCGGGVNKTLCKNDSDPLRPQALSINLNQARDRFLSTDMQKIIQNREIKTEFETKHQVDTVLEEQAEYSTMLNTKQQNIFKRDKNDLQRIFSKLPCIKTCMSKMQIQQQPGSFSTGPVGDCHSKRESCGNKQPKYEQSGDDFGTYTVNQISTASCKSTCDNQQLCPEILPSNCDDFLENRCDCTTYCKKTLKYLQQFVKDATHYAEIEDLCKVMEVPACGAEGANDGSDQMMINLNDSNNGEEERQMQ